MLCAPIDVTGVAAAAAAVPFGMTPTNLSASFLDHTWYYPGAPVVPATGQPMGLAAGAALTLDQTHHVKNMKLYIAFAFYALIDDSQLSLPTFLTDNDMLQIVNTLPKSGLTFMQKAKVKNISMLVLGYYLCGVMSCVNLVPTIYIVKFHLNY